MKLQESFFLKKVLVAHVVNLIFLSSSAVIISTRSVIGTFLDLLDKSSIFSTCRDLNRSIFEFDFDHISFLLVRHVKTSLGIALILSVLLGSVKANGNVYALETSEDFVPVVRMCAANDTKVLKGGPHRGFTIKCQDYNRYLDLMVEGRLDEARRLLTVRPK